MPMERMRPAIPAIVSVTGMSLKMASVIATYRSSASTAISPGSRNHRIINTATARNPMMPAVTLRLSESLPKLASTDCWDMSEIGTGRAPALRRPANSRADSGVKLPVICALPSPITSLTTGAEIGAPSRYIASRLPIFFLVISAKMLAPSSVSSRVTSGWNVVGSKFTSARLTKRPVSCVGANSRSSFMRSPFPCASAIAFCSSAGRSSRNSRYGVSPMSAIEAPISRTPASSTMRRDSSPLFSICTSGSATPKRFTRRSITSRSDFIAVSRSPAATALVSARYTRCVPP